MGMIYCPECGAKISSKAKICPKCGYESVNPNLPIAVQEKFETVPLVHFELADYTAETGIDVFNNVEDNKNIYEFFGKWANIQRYIPSIGKIIDEMSRKEKTLVVEMDDYVKKLIEEGVYHFSKDKNGQLLPTIRDAKHIVKQVRLKEIECPPQINDSLNNLSTHMALNQVLSEIEDIKLQILDIHAEFQNDRVAKAESALEQMRFAAKIQDTDLRRLVIATSIKEATEAKHLLMKSFENNFAKIESKKDLNSIQRIMKSNDQVQEKADEIFQTLGLITNMVQIESTGYAVLGEYEAAKEALGAFGTFVKTNKLDKKNTMLEINEFATKNHQASAEKFHKLSVNITKFNKFNPCIEYKRREIEDGKRKDEVLQEVQEAPCTE